LFGVPIPMKLPPVCNGMIAPRDSWMMPPPCNEMIPPGRRALVGLRKFFVTPMVAEVSFVGKMADGDLVHSPPIPA
jgi:hypothetical protein